MSGAGKEFRAASKEPPGYSGLGIVVLQGRGFQCLESRNLIRVQAGEQTGGLLSTVCIQNRSLTNLGPPGFKWGKRNKEFVVIYL